MGDRNALRGRVDRKGGRGKLTGQGGEVERAEHPWKSVDRAGRIGRKEGTARRGTAEKTGRRGRWA
jgi:hypothetical protein